LSKPKLIKSCRAEEEEEELWISEQTANFALHIIKKLVYIPEVKSVYCAVRAEFLYKTGTFLL
jgi:hypothetical protein